MIFLNPGASDCWPESQWPFSCDTSVSELIDQFLFSRISLWKTCKGYSIQREHVLLDRRLSCFPLSSFRLWFWHPKTDHLGSSCSRCIVKSNSWFQTFLYFLVLRALLFPVLICLTEVPPKQLHICKIQASPSQLSGWRRAALWA